MTTRFTHDTWNQNQMYKRKHGIESCIYGTPIRVTQDIPRKSILVVLEMLNCNDRNSSEWPGRIIGIGITRNYSVNSKKIYENDNFNRHVYMGLKHYDIDELEINHPKLVEYIKECVEPRLFRGRDHSKRGIGITRLPSRINMNDFQKVMEPIVNINA